jgi:hypothetical protein
MFFKLKLNILDFSIYQIVKRHESANVTENSQRGQYFLLSDCLYRYTSSCLQ